MVTNKELVFDDTEGVWSATFLWTYNAITRTIIASMVLKQGDVETLKHTKWSIESELRIWFFRIIDIMVTIAVARNFEYMIRELLKLNKWLNDFHFKPPTDTFG